MGLARPAEAQPLPVPQKYPGRRRIPSPDFPDTINSIQALIAFISSRVGPNPDFDTLQSLAFTILHYTMLGPDVLRFVADNYLKSFSKIKWGDMLPYFRHSLDTSIYHDCRAIRPYRLQRSRLPIDRFKSILAQLDVSRRTLGMMNDLENEPAKQLYISPIPSTLLSMFSGRLINLPEHTLTGRITTSGRCEFSVTLLGMVMLVFIEVKDTLKGGSAKHSDLVAQVLAEADGADLFNKVNECDGIGIHAILTDGQRFEFYLVNFYDWRVMRGVGSPVEAVPWIDGYQLCLPSSERAPNFRSALKCIVEVIFDTIIMAYINGVSARKSYSQRQARMEDSEMYVPRRSTSFWDEAYTRATNALAQLRLAHGHRLVNKVEADAMAFYGLDLLTESVMSIPLPDTDWSLLDGWEDAADALLGV